MSAANASVSETAAPMRSASSPISICVSSATLPTWMTDGSSRSCFVTQSPTSVPPATRRVDDRTITGAATEVAGQRIVDGAPRWTFRRFVQREQRHHEAGRAKAALRCVTFDERLLDRMQRAVVAFQALGGDELLAVERWHELNAGIDGAEPDAIAGKLSDHDGAGAAIALGATFLRPDS